MKKPIRVAVTGPAGQIGYSLLFRIASGAMLGPDQPVILSLLERDNPQSQNALKGVMMELEDCAFPLLADMTCSSDTKIAFKDAEYALLVGARPRGPGMERADLLADNAEIFQLQGRGQPLQHQCLYCYEERAFPLASLLLRNVAFGPEPCHESVGQESGCPRHRCEGCGCLGEPLSDDVRRYHARNREGRPSLGLS